MTDAARRRQGLGLLIVSLVLDIGLIALFAAMGGASVVSMELLGMLVVLVLVQLGVWGLWRSGRSGLAWALLLIVPGLALAGLVGFFILFAIGIS